MKQCSRCTEPQKRGQRYCGSCHAAYLRHWRETRPLTETQKLKDRARSYAGVYKRRGHLTEEPCRICYGKAEMHHADYDKPLEVLWLCRECHLTLHRVKALAESYDRSRPR